MTPRCSNRFLRGKCTCRSWSSSLTVAIALTMLTLGCQTAPETPTHAPDEALATNRAPSVGAVKAAEGELGRLDDELSVFDTRLAPALSAVNYTIMRFPHCLDPLFETYSRLDLGRREIVVESTDLTARIARVKSGALDAHKLISVENRARQLRDRVAHMNAELAMLFADAMADEPTCARAQTAQTVTSSN